MKTVGVIGGLGPETTSEFYLELIFSCYQKDKSQRPPILIWNVPLNYKIEEDLILKSEGNVTKETIEYFKKNDINNIILAHCTSDEVCEYFKNALNSKTKVEVLGSGSIYEMDNK